METKERIILGDEEGQRMGKGHMKHERGKELGWEELQETEVGKMGGRKLTKTDSIQMYWYLAHSMLT